MKYPRVARACLVLGSIGAVVGVVVLHIRGDEARISRVQVGMTVVDVEALLGAPDYRFNANEFDAGRMLMPDDSACRSNVAVYLVYKRTARDSLMVYLDGSGNVSCTARLNVLGLDPHV